MLNYFSTNLAILHKKHMVKICNCTLAGDVSNGAHGQVSHVFTGIVTLFARTFFNYSTDIHILASVCKIQMSPVVLCFFSTVVQYHNTIGKVKTFPRSFCPL